MKHSSKVMLGIGMSLGVVLQASAEDAEAEAVALPTLAASTEQVSVVGVSSGGYMAAQLAVAWPEHFQGLGIVAAGPWGCAQGALSLALNQCMMTRRGLPELDELESRRRDYLKRDQVGSTEALGDLRVFTWHGQEDEVIDPALGERLAEQFLRWLDDPEQLKATTSEEAGHGWPVNLTRSAATSPQDLADCRQGGDSHVLACDLELAQEMLDWLHPDAETAATDAPAEGELVRFDQSDFDAKGLADEGYLYVPQGCAEGGCGVTLALHGCQMSHDQIGDTFIRHSGINRWADRHQQLVLYPQATSSMANPQGCWDWWGFAESSWQLNPLHDTRDGTQTGALMQMLQRLQD
ncbi:PHB depolymerase family esterase [Halomonas sp. Bachu 37]|uniref:PHB depolymerase family esterase n=1 Tax=Halomonas kashgarensis TaxID=3084920 RepID=UPI00321779F7